MVRKTFFSFHYQPDVWRAYNVRNSWTIKGKNEDSGFFDGSIFEAKKRESHESLMRFIREGMENTSVTCVLSGYETWTRPWVRYEIVRSVLKNNGIINLYIHNVKDSDGNCSKKGENPLDYVGVYKENNKLYFVEFVDGKWIYYEDYKTPIQSCDFWFPDPDEKSIVQLSKYYKSYDYISHDGRANLPAWIEAAAKQVGR